uniref:Uncharacterized protein n=1 Tax=Arundo donax TaxID=35708 RepID=A0A0A8ZQN9_ARUDO
MWLLGRSWLRHTLIVVRFRTHGNCSIGCQRGMHILGMP